MSNLSLVLKQGIWTNVSQFRRICLWFCCSCLRGTFNLLVHLMSSHELLHNRDQIPLRGNAEDIYLTSPLSSSAFVVASHHSCLTAIFIAHSGKPHMLVLVSSDHLHWSACILHVPLNCISSWWASNGVSTEMKPKNLFLAREYRLHQWAVSHITHKDAMRSSQEVVYEEMQYYRSHCEVCKCAINNTSSPVRMCSVEDEIQRHTVPERRL